jgi:hypothetical protein
VSSGSRVNLILLAGLAGGFLPWKMGIEYLDASVLLPCSLISVMFVSAQLPPGCVTRTAATATLYSTTILLLGIIVVNTGFWFGSPIIPPSAILLSAVMLGFGASCFATSAAQRMMARDLTPHEAASRIRLGLLFLLGLWMFRHLIPATLTELIAPAATTTGIPLIIGLICAILLAVCFRWQAPQGGVVH